MKPTPEKQAQIEVNLARANERWKARAEERERRRGARKALRERLNAIQGVVYFHYRPGIFNTVESRGGVCVAAQVVGDTLVLAASVCARSDTYDKLEARRYAVDRLQLPHALDPLGTIVVRFIGGGMKHAEFVRRMANLVAHNAIACLGKRVDREWLERRVF